MVIIEFSAFDFSLYIFLCVFFFYCTVFFEQNIIPVCVVMVIYYLIPYMKVYYNNHTQAMGI